MQLQSAIRQPKKLLLLPGFALLLAVMGLCGCGKKSSTPKASPKEEKAEAYKLLANGLNIAYDDPTTKKRVWHLKSDRAVAEYNSGNIKYAQIEGVTAEFYEKGELSLRLKADRASYDPDMKKVHLEGNIRGESVQEKATLQADALHWDSEKNEMTATGAPVTVLQADKYQLTSDYLIANTKLQRLRNH